MLLKRALSVSHNPVKQYVYADTCLDSIHDATNNRIQLGRQAPKLYYCTGHHGLCGDVYCLLLANVAGTGGGSMLVQLFQPIFGIFCYIQLADSG